MRVAWRTVGRICDLIWAPRICPACRPDVTTGWESDAAGVCSARLGKEESRPQACSPGG
jgi:hypothetical protein